MGTAGQTQTHETSTQEQPTEALERTMRVLLAVVAIAVTVFALIMVNMDDSSMSQGGRIYVAVGALVALGVVDSQLLRLADLQSGFGTSQYKKDYSLFSLILFVVVAVVLLGCALYLPR